MWSVENSLTLAISEGSGLADHQRPGTLPGVASMTSLTFWCRLLARESSGTEISEIPERSCRSRGPYRGEGIQLCRRDPAPRSSARLSQHGQPKHDPLPLLRDTVSF